MFFLKVRKSLLASCLTSRSITTTQESVNKPLSSKQASDCRDAFVKVKKLICPHRPPNILFHDQGPTMALAQGFSLLNGSLTAQGSGCHRYEEIKCAYVAGDLQQTLRMDCWQNQQCHLQQSGRIPQILLPVLRTA